MDEATIKRIMDGPGSDREKMQELRDEGLSNVQIAKLFAISRQRVAVILGPIPYRKRGGADIHIIVADDVLKQVKKLAKQLGAVAYQGPDTGNGSVGVLLDKIASGDLMIFKRDDLVVQDDVA